MAGSSFAVSSSNGNISATCTWSSYPDVNTNSSSVYVELRASRTNTGYTTYGTGVVKLTINGTEYDIGVGAGTKITYNSNTLMGSATSTVAHESDGSKQISISAYMYIDAPLTLGTTTGTATLDNIARASVPTVSSDNVNIGSSVTIYTHRASSNFTHTISCTLGGNTVEIANGVTDSYSWAIPAYMASYIPNNPSGLATITCKTYTDGGNTYVGSEPYTMTLTVPSSYIPTATLYLTGNNLLSGSYIQSKSTVTAITTDVITQSNYSSCTVTVKNTTYNYTATYSGKNVLISLPYPGSYTITSVVTDTRTRNSTITSANSKSISVLAYNDPYFTSFTAYRATDTNVPSDSGVRLSWNAVGNVSPCNNGTSNLNTATYTLSYKLTSSSTWTNSNITDDFTLSSSGYTIAISADYSYDVKFTITDAYKTVTSVASIPTAFVLVDLYNNGTGLAIGKVAELANTFDVALASKFRNGINVTGAISTGSLAATGLVNAGSISTGTISTTGGITAGSNVTVSGNITATNSSLYGTTVSTTNDYSNYLTNYTNAQFSGSANFNNQPTVGSANLFRALMMGTSNSCWTTKTDGGGAGLLGKWTDGLCLVMAIDAGTLNNYLFGLVWRCADANHTLIFHTISSNGLSFGGYNQYGTLIINGGAASYIHVVAMGFPWY